MSDVHPQVIIGGMSELDLEIVVHRLTRQLNDKTSIGKPQVAYKEALTKPPA